MNKISSRALLLVALLLLFESTFVGVYFVLLSKAEEESAKQQRAREVIATTNQLLDSMYLAGDNVSKSIFHPEQASSSAYESARKEILEKLVWLHEHVESDPSQQVLLQRIDDGTQKALSMLAKMKKISDTQEPVLAMQYGLNMRTRMQKHLEALVHDFIEFLNVEKRIESQTPVTLKAKREQQKWFLIAGLVANILVALAVALAFVRNITSRLAVVVDNSQRLLARKDLNRPLAGSDELSQLDSAFHSMSSSLRGEEELVKASEVQLHAIIDQMPIGVLIIDESDVIEYANPTLAKMLGFTDGVTQSTRFSDHFSANLSSLKVEDGAVDLKAVKANGQSIDVEFSFVNVTLADQSRRLAVVSDVTEKHAVEKMKQAFVAMVSHELRTPLTSVSGYLQLLPMGVYGEVDGRATAAISQTESQVEELIVLINDLLDLEKLQAGKMELNRAKVSLEDVVDDAMDSVYNLANLQAAELLFAGCETIVYGDRERLRQALTKVLTCMLRLGEKAQKIEIRVDADQSNNVLIKFSSKRIALSQRDIDYMFEPFHRTQTGLVGSLGLGLTLSRAIAAQMGGECGADTMAGGGTTLWLSLPFAA